MRSWRLVLAVLVLMALAAMAGVAVDSVIRDRLAQTPSAVGPGVVTVPVTAERLRSTVVLGGSVRRTPLATLPVPQADGADDRLPVVTEVLAKQGRQVLRGEVVVEISGRPVFLLDGAFPFYRDLYVGDSGPDVFQLRRALVAVGLEQRVGSWLGPQTARAMELLYRRSGYTSPAASTVAAADPSSTQSKASPASSGRGQGPVVRRAEVIVVRRSVRGVFCDVKAAVGRRPGAVVATVCSGGVGFSATVPGSPADLPRAGTGRLRQGTTVRTVRWRVLAGRDKGGKATRTVVAEGLAAKGLRPGGPARLELMLRASEPGDLVVPVAALWSRAGQVGVYAGAAGDRWVPVQVRFTVDGQAAVTADGLDAADVVALDSPTALAEGG